MVSCGKIEHQPLEGEARVGVVLQPVGRAARGFYHTGAPFHAEGTGVVAQSVLAVHAGEFWSLGHTQQVHHQEERPMEFLHPANVEEVTNIAEEIGTEVLRGPLRYPSEAGGWQLDDRGDTERQ